MEDIESIVDELHTDKTANDTTIQNEEQTVETVNTDAPKEAEAPEPEIIPSMDEFQDEIERSFRKLEPGDIVSGTVIGVSDSEVTVDLGSYAEGIIKADELSNDPRFSIKADIVPGDKIEATVLRETRAGAILLSLKQADDILAWDKLQKMMDEHTVSKVKIAEAVKGGVTTFLCGTRAFIPASQLGLEYVEDLEAYIGKTIDVTVITVDRENQKLVLSGREIARERAINDRNSRISKLQTGLVTTGVVEKLMPFGAFVNIGEDLSGLVHISQICGKHLKSPAEVLKVGQEVTVKIMDVKDGKISLSIKAVDEKEEVYEDAVDEASEEFTDGVEATTSLASLLKNLKF